MSTEICSLQPGVDRLVLSALMEIDRAGETVAQEFCRGRHPRLERMTYTDVQRCWTAMRGSASVTRRWLNASS